MLEKGDTLKRKYDIVKVVGTGSQSVVYHGKDFMEGKDVAIKEMKKGGSMNEDLTSIDLYRQEVFILSHSDYPGIPKIYDQFEEKGNLYIIMEYVPGKDLQQILDEKEKLTPAQALFIAIQVADILDHLHSLEPPIYFRDVKPSNIMFTGSMVYLVDFAGCYMAHSGMGEGVMIRTRGYSPPEARRMTRPDPMFDVYGLGMLLYRMASGINVVQFKDAAPPLNAKKEKLPPALVQIINKAIRRNRYTRYHTALEMKTEMEDLLKNIKGANYGKKKEEGVLLPSLMKLVEDKEQKEDQPSETENPEQNPGKKPSIFQRIKNFIKKKFFKEKKEKTRINLFYTVRTFIVAILVPFLDMAVFGLVPLLIFREEFAKTFLLMKDPLPMPPGYYVFALIILILHFIHRHWLDWWAFFAPISRELHLPQLGGIRPNSVLFFFELVLLFYCYYSLVTLKPI